ncbi:MAG: alpha/beta hydrolase [Gammaproteobacteria bacterium]
MLIKIFLALIVFYLLAMLAIYFAQAWFIYAPNMPTRELTTTPKDIGLDYEDVFLKTNDNEKIHAWFIPKSSSNSLAEKTILFMHGNAGNISHRLETIQIFHRLGFNIFIFDYRGFGNSTGSPSEKGTYLDANAAWNFLRDDKNLTPEQIIIAGRSLGGGVATEIAENVSPAMLILESTFTSMLDVSKIHYPFMPTELIVKHEYETVNKLKNISCPVLIIHSVDDEVIPFAHSKTNFDNANSPKKLIELRGGHGNGFLLSRQVYIEGLQNAFQSMLQ